VTTLAEDVKDTPKLQPATGGPISIEGNLVLDSANPVLQAKAHPTTFEISDTPVDIPLTPVEPKKGEPSKRTIPSADSVVEAPVVQRNLRGKVTWSEQLPDMINRFQNPNMSSRTSRSGGKRDRYQHLFQ
jgi:hypothetical protein